GLPVPPRAQVPAHPTPPALRVLHRGGQTAGLRPARGVPQHAIDAGRRDHAVSAWRFASQAVEDGPFLIAGPCVIEADGCLLRIADRLAGLAEVLKVRICFKASFDKANRARLASERGPGLEAGLAALERVRRASGLPVLTDVHEPAQAAVAARVVDALQVPAFLSRQTDLLVACGRAGKPVNLKKGQWLDPDAMRGAVEKVREGAGGAGDVAVTERGT